MKFSKGICNACGKDGMFAKPSLKLCPVCNQKRLNNLKTNDEGQRRGVIATRKPLVRKVQKRRRITGEGVMFLAIWRTRPHVCVNCKVRLDEEAKAGYFAHIKPKSTHPELRLDMNNVMLLCYDCHYAFDHGGKEQFKKRSVNN